MIKCPYCMCDSVKLVGSNYKCLGCGNSFSPSEVNKSSSILSSLNLRRGGNTNTNSNGALSGDQIYSRTIDGICEVICADINSCGSGFVYTRDGLVMTNAHVISNGNRVSGRIVCRISGKTIPCECLLCGDPDYVDIAVLRLDCSPSMYKVLELGDSNTVKNGEKVYHIGNSLGEGICITSGIVSDKDRNVNGKHYIMTDTAINPGNSGCPLINEQGKVVGVCVAKRNGADGMKYSIAINEALSFVKNNL